MPNCAQRYNIEQHTTWHRLCTTSCRFWLSSC